MMISNKQLKITDTLQELVNNPDQNLFEQFNSTVKKGKKYTEANQSKNSKMAFQKDVDYFWGWMTAFLYPNSFIESYPVPQEFIYSFAVHHLVEPDDLVDNLLVASGYKQNNGLLAYSTVKRMLTSLQKAHYKFAPDLMKRYVFSNSQVTDILQSAAENYDPKQSTPLLLEHIEAMIEATNDDLKGSMSRAILSVAFASGGRRRTEIRNLTMTNLKKIKTDDYPGYYYSIKLTKTKTEKKKASEVGVFDKAAFWLDEWLICSGIQEGYVFRTPYKRILGSKAIGERWIGHMLQELVNKADLKLTKSERKKVSAHSLRSGFATETALQGIPEFEAMEMGLWKNSETFRKYTRTHNIQKNRAAHLLKNIPSV